MFVSLSFLLLLAVSTFIFYLLKGENRIYFLALVSLFYCFYLDKYAAIVVMAVSLINYGAGRVIYRISGKKQKVVMYLVLLIDIGILCTYKYGFSFLESIGLEGLIGDSILGLLLMPIGLSFYVFQAMSYIIDIRQKLYKPENNYLYFLLYMCFFTKFVSGPIERMDQFKKSLERIKFTKFLNRARLSETLTFILYGYFMKVVVADRLVITVDKIFEAPSSYGSFWLMMGILLYSLQIYTDFAGYSYIAVGASKLFGIDININFRNPYFASSISDFWRRWHMSLSGWLKDYIYIPLGGNRKGRINKFRNTLIVFLICGLWHGQGINYLVWGFLHGIYSIMSMVFVVKSKIAGCIILLVQVAFAWLFFRATSFSAALGYLWNCINPGKKAAGIVSGYSCLGLNITEVLIIFLSVLFIFLMEFFSERKKEIVPVTIQHLNNTGRYIFYYFMIIAIIIFGIYGPGYDTSKFVYMQF